MKETLKQIAILCMRKLGIHKDYIKAFSDEDKLTNFEQYGGYYLEEGCEDNNEVLAKVKEIEKEYDIVVFAITHELTSFGECYSMLYVSEETSDLDDWIDGDSFTFFQRYVPAYVWNKTYDECSEFGSVVVASMCGGIKRVA